ncbi:XRE family transcriptional regulator, partial [Acinetobacter baumannii]
FQTHIKSVKYILRYESQSKHQRIKRKG